MPTHIALLRAINVGGTGKLPMVELRALCERIGLTNVRTYIQSGNVVFESRKSAARVKADLEAALEQRMGKRHVALVRSAEELAGILKRVPFANADPKRVLVLFLDAPPPRGILDGWKIPGRERMHLDGRELYVHFPDGMGTSKLKVPFADLGTGRNLNSLQALLTLATE